MDQPARVRGGCCIRDSGALGDQSAPKRIGIFEVSVVRYPPGSHLPRHDHDRASVLIVLDGEFGETDGRTRRACTPGEALIRASHHRHANRFPSGCTVLLAMIDHDASIRDPGLLPRFDRSGSRACASAARPTFGLADRVLLGSTLDLLHIEDLMLEALSLGAGDRDARAMNPPGWLKETLEFIHAQPAPAPISRIAERAGLNPSHMARAFRRWRGCTLSQYTRRLALQRAADDLCSTTLPLASIARHRGFADQSHMTREFARVFGTPPGAFRNAHNPCKTGRAADVRWD